MDAKLLSLEFDGTSLQRSNLTVWLDVTEGLDEVPDVRGVDTLVPSLPGRIPQNRVLDELDVVLEGWVQGLGVDEDARLASFDTLRDELRGLFDPLAMPATLEGDTAGGDHKAIPARCIGLRWGPENIRGVRSLQVLLRCLEDWTTT